MDIHEFQAKLILSSFGAHILRGYVAFSMSEAEKLIQNFSGDAMVIKAQVHAGGRGKAGGVKLAKSKEEALQFAKNMLGMKLVTKQTGAEGKIVSKLYIEDVLNIKNEFYLSLIVDRDTNNLCFVASKAGGMDIEEVAEKNPEAILKVVIDAFYGLQDFHIQRIGYFLGLTDKAKFASLRKTIRALYECFLAKDASQIEINPLVETVDGDDLVVLDAKMSFDDNALYRQKEVAELFDEDEINKLELEAGKFDLNYIKLEGGKIGCMVNGAGLAMATMDMIKHCGSAPANFLDVGGGATQERVREALKIILADQSVKGILINIFGGIVKCDMIADGIVAAAKEVGIKIPLVVRLSGTNYESGKIILEKSGINLISTSDLGEAAQKIVEIVERG